MKQQYRTRNWPEYNAGLVKRGSLTFWVSEDVVQAWVSSQGKRMKIFDPYRIWV
jgi:heme-degrading monooxygenase HmoA